ncbi:hypothetical protein [Winogradskyella undariae]|uniref:hypothetical protein n=1 Tax=Winogradskyella undariae TaxID=1285465 RepID=UPI0015CE54AA|nr:hypothetical protein [Winogradskyella undariae]
MIIKTKSPLGVIKKSLEIAVLQNKPQVFLDYLLSNTIKTSFPNKLSFYNFFKEELVAAYKTSTGHLHLKIETPKYENEGYSHYCFYDKVHKNSRIYIKVKVLEQILYLDMLPF